MIVFFLFLYMLNPQNKLMAGQRSDVLESLTPQVRNRVEALRDIQVRQVCFVLIY